MQIVVDTREQRPLVFAPGVQVVRDTLSEGDYAARGYESFARIERKSSADLWGTLTGGHDRFNRELARLGDIPRVAIVVDDALGPADAILTSRGGDPFAFAKVIRAIQWNGRIPVIWAGTRERAAQYVQWALQGVVDDFSGFGQCEDIARSAGPYTTAADMRQAVLASLYGICVVCARRPPKRPKAPGPGICICGRVARGGAEEDAEA